MKFLGALLLLLPLNLFSQSRIDGWRAHVSFTPVILVTETPEDIVAATANGIFSVNKQGGQINTITKVEGLSEVGINAIAYVPSANFLLIGYKSGNLDLLQNGKILNLPDISRKIGLSDKTIYRIISEGNFAYLCCGFGVVRIDLQKIEVAETWYFGSATKPIGVFDLVIYNDKWWAATNEGLFMADKQNSNLLDFRNWQLQIALPPSDASFSSFAKLDEKLFVHDKSNDRILTFNGLSWSTQYPEIKNIRGVRSAATGIIVLCDQEIRQIGKTGNTLINNYFSGNSMQRISPMDALISSTGELWIGDSSYGLTRKTGASGYVQVVPDSPGSDEISALKADNESIFAATVLSGANGTPEAAISIRQDGIWQNFTATEDPGMNAVAPITSFAVSKEHPDEYWAATAGSGLLYFSKNRVAARYNESNSTLGALDQACIVKGLALDNQNNLWYTNPTGKVPLGIRSTTGTFTPLPYPGMNSVNSAVGDMIISSTSTHWVILPDEGLFAFKIKGSTGNISDDQYRKVIVRSRFTNGVTTLVSQFNGISAIAEDQNNQLWVGTSTGVVVYGNPDKIFDTGEFYGYQPSLRDEEGLFKPILEKEKITAIAVDGGNRKWIGTANSGVFLFTGEGERLLHHFDSRNSPLLSDHIKSIAISPKSGEVFIATDQGLISFVSDATMSEANFNKAYVWPNPLRENFDGGVTIDGLTDGTGVKITDVAGNLIYETTSLGGRARWNARNANGLRVSTGVYLIFCNSSQIRNSTIMKLLVIH
jgi:ligand-binding sensor domain-containing protein